MHAFRQFLRESRGFGFAGVLSSVTISTSEAMAMPEFQLGTLFLTSNKKAQLSLTNPRDACEKYARFT